MAKLQVYIPGLSVFDIEEPGNIILIAEFPPDANIDKLGADVDATHLTRAVSDSENQEVLIEHKSGQEAHIRTNPQVITEQHDRFWGSSEKVAL